MAFVVSIPRGARTRIPFHSRLFPELSSSLCPGLFLGLAIRPSGTNRCTIPLYLPALLHKEICCLTQNLRGHPSYLPSTLKSINLMARNGVTPEYVGRMRGCRKSVAKAVAFNRLRYPVILFSQYFSIVIKLAG